MITVLQLPEPAWDFGEIRRYCGARQGDGEIDAILLSCAEEAKPHLSYAVCYTRLPVLRVGEELRIGSIETSSRVLQKALSGCDSALLFAATVGIGIDRLILKYGRLSPLRATLLQGIGAERIEGLCNAFCDRFGEELSPRVSPGYGDIPLPMQRQIFALLDCPRKIGLTLSEGMLMTPTKSVTAFAGVRSR